MLPCLVPVLFAFYLQDVLNLNVKFRLQKVKQQDMMLLGGMEETISSLLEVSGQSLPGLFTSGGKSTIIYRMGGCGVGFQPAQYHLTILRAANSIQIYNLQKRTEDSKENKSIFELYTNIHKI